MSTPEDLREVEEARALRVRAALLLQEAAIRQKQLVEAMEMREQALSDRLYLIYQFIFAIQARRPVFRAKQTIQ